MATISKIKISSKEVEVVTADNKANLTVKFENTLPYQLIPLSVLSQISNISSYQGELSINDILNIIIERFHHNIFFKLNNRFLLSVFETETMFSIRFLIKYSLKKFISHNNSKFHVLSFMFLKKNSK